MLTSFQIANKYTKPIRIFGFLLCIAFLLYVPSVQADEAVKTDIDDILALTIEQLMRVTVVSFHKERVVDSPAVVSTYTADELNKLGLYSLKDFISFVPGVEVNESLAGEIPIQIRGLAETSNQKILLLLNGTPYWAPSNGDIPLLGIPIAAIEKIEVIRGPGSVMYGTNASAGVINVVTREDSSSEITTYFGSNDFYNSSLFVSHDLGTGNRVSLAIEIQGDNGYQSKVTNAFNLFSFDCFCFPEDFSGTFDRFEEMESILSTLKYEGLDITLQAFQSEIHSGANGSVVGTGEYQQRGSLLHVGYETEKGNVLWNLYTNWNRFYSRIPTKKIIGLAGFPEDGVVSFDNSGEDNVRWTTGVKTKFNLQENLTWLNGIEYERRGTEDYRFYDGANGNNLTAIGLATEDDGSALLIAEDRNDEKSFFTQLDYIRNKWRFVGGIRYVSNSDAGSHSSPRVSLVYSLSNNSSLKLLYSEGFNSPTFRQTSAIDQLGFPTEGIVKPEIITSWDFAYTHTNQDTHFVANIYHEMLEDGINSIGGEFVNEGTIYRNGLELDLRKHYRNWSILIGASYVDEGNELISDDTSAQFGSKFLGKLGISYTLGKHSLGASLRGSSKRSSVSSYSNLNLNYQYENGYFKGFLLLVNALDEEILFPDVRSENSVVMQVEDKASLYAGITFSF